ncbi:ABC transporter ATP-binding protein [Christensenella hongkongensis]|uniref:ABC transporter ATP-binding protein n=1 Tax=Christensenella hongkongensis TaxID=270498 RepID=A0A0M2NDS4_9FIRM|nr:ABC transporter ATP-binding protein [Christensenella hongkongensis]
MKNADQILVVDDGKIVQQGKHKELVSQPGIYRDFIDIRKKSAGWQIG